MAEPLTLAAIQAAIAKYAPILQIHPDEKYNLCSIEWFLTHCTLIDSKTPSNNITHPLETQLPHGPKDGTRYYLNIEDSVKPGNFSTAKAYVNAFWTPGMTYTDLQFWFFSAFNGPGTALFSSLLNSKPLHTGTIDLSPLGEHVGDWEYVALRISNSTSELLGLMLSAHGKNIFYDAATVKSQFEIRDGHPVVYSSLNGHANFPAPGPNYTEHRRILGTPAGLDFNLLNSTAAGGLSFPCSSNYQLVNAPSLKEVVAPAWVGYPYRWGPEGTAIHMDAKTLGLFVKAALGEQAKGGVWDTLGLLAAGELLSIFVKADINGAGAPSGQGPWSGHY